MKKLKINLQLFNDEIPGLLSRGTALSYSTDGTAYTPVAAVQSIPEMGNTPEAVDVTHLGSARMSSIAGLESSENLDFDIVYQGTNFADLHGISGNGQQIHWRVTYPDGLMYEFKGESVLRMGATEVNSALGITLTVVVSEGPDPILPSEGSSPDPILSSEGSSPDPILSSEGSSPEGD